VKPIRRFLRLSFDEQFLLVKAALLLTAVRLGLLLLPFRTICKFLGRFAKPSSDSDDVKPSYRDDVIWAVATANKYLPGSSACLQEALIGYLLLRRSGFRASLRIGVSKGNDRELLAHAWVEDGGEIIIGGPRSEVERFKPLEDPDVIGL